MTEKIERVLIGGARDGERVRCEADREYIVLPVQEPMAAGDYPPIAIDSAVPYKRAIYTRRRWQVDRFAPVTCMAAIELTDREVIELLIARHAK